MLECRTGENRGDAVTRSLWRIVAIRLDADSLGQAIDAEPPESRSSVRAQGYVEKGRLYQARQDYGEAAKWYCLALDLAPGDRNALRWLGESFLQLRFYREAFALFDQLYRPTQ